MTLNAEEEDALREARRWIDGPIEDLVRRMRIKRLSPEHRAVLLEGLAATALLMAKRERELPQ